ncbi:MAG: hypothetical protein QME96_08270, partial [Myxococcota bacterium]|nr:hypothetical protein [Myxococcota bacterium]
VAAGLVAVVAAVVVRWTGRDPAPDAGGAEPPAVVASARDAGEGAPIVSGAPRVRPPDPEPARIDVGEPQVEDAARGAGDRPAAAGADDRPLAGEGVASTGTTGDDAGGESAGQGEPVRGSPSTLGRPDTVRFTFVGLPRGAVARVDGERVGAGGVLDVPWSDRPVDVVVEPPGRVLAPYVMRLAPTEDRTIRSTFRATASRGDAGASGRDAGRADGTIEGRSGAVFATEYP